MKTAGRAYSAAMLRDLVASALTSDYVPTLLGPEHDSLATAFDTIMAELGLEKRAWRGSRLAENRRRMDEKVAAATVRP